MSYFSTLWAYLISSAPYLMFGLFIAGIVKSFLSLNFIKERLSKPDLKTVMFSSALGVPLPLCSCSVVPAAVELKKAGASNGATSSFLISTPESGIDSIALTYSLMDLPMAIFRPVIAFFSATIAGFFQNHFNHHKFIAIEEEKPSCCSVHSHSRPHSQGKSLSVCLKNGLTYAFTDLIDDIAFWLSIGLLIGAGIDCFVPAEFFIGLSGWSARLAILSIGLPLYICASASTPIAASFVVKGMSPGIALIFLLVGPATNLSNITVLQKYIGKKGIIINLIVISLVALCASFAVDYFYLGKNILWKTNQHNHATHSWWEILSAILLCLLLLKGIYLEVKGKIWKK